VSHLRRHRVTIQKISEDLLESLVGRSSEAIALNN
jgi:hypothetical protein